MDSRPYVPISGASLFSYRKEEANGEISVITSTHPEIGVISFNRTAMYILECCNGDLSLNSIISRVLEKYDVSPDDAIRDVNAIVHKLWRLGLIYWKNDICPFANEYKKDCLSFQIKFMQEQETVDFCNSLVKDRITHYDAYAEAEYELVEQHIRHKWFRGYETFYEVMYQGEKVVISIGSFSKSLNAFTITGIYMKEINPLASSIILEVISFAKNIYNRLFGVNYMSGEELMFFVHAIRSIPELSPYYIGELVHEIISGSIFVYSIPIPGDELVAP